MPIFLKSSIHRTFAEALMLDISSNINQYFLFIAKSTPWPETTGASADIVPTKSPNTVEEEYDIMGRVIGYKKLDPSKIIFAIPRYTWKDGDYYDEYSDVTELFDPDDPKMFYVITSSNNMYKCIGATTGSAEVQPTHTSSTPVLGADGYTWKYLTTISDSLLPYETIDYIPVKYSPTSLDTESTLQFNAQSSAISGELTRLETTSLGGASAAYYLGSEYGARFAVGATGATAATGFGVGDAYTITSSSFTNRFSVASSDINHYLGNILRIVAVGGPSTNASDVNRYGIIIGVTADLNSYAFTVRGEHIEFNFKGPVGTDYVHYDIIPYVKITGDGSDAYAFPVLGVTGSADWRKITGIQLISGGSNYSQAIVNVVSPKSDGSVIITDNQYIHPTFTAVLSPKGGHASNVLKELNAKDVMIIAELTSDDAAVKTGGSYRQFGIVKNPVLNDGSGIIAGSKSKFLQDINLIYDGPTALTTSNVPTIFFPGGSTNYIVGTETYSSFPVLGVKSVGAVSGEMRVLIQVSSSNAKLTTYADRLKNYSLTTVSAVPDFELGEVLTQSIPSGITIDALGGISFGYALSSEATLLSFSGKEMGVRVTKNAFVRGTTNNLWITGSLSGKTASIQSIALAYGEKIWVNHGGSLAKDGGLTAELFRVVDQSAPYWSASASPSYSGLAYMHMGKTAGQDAFTNTTWKHGDFIQQGTSADYKSNYASGTVYSWDRTSDDIGTLGVSETFGIFNSSVLGATTSRLNSTGINTGYIVSSIVPPEIDPHSGEVVYINSLQPIIRLPNQTEEFRIRIGF